MHNRRHLHSRRGLHSYLHIRPCLLMVNRQWRHRLHMYNLLHIRPRLLMLNRHLLHIHLRHIINIIKLLYRNFEPCVCAEVFVSKFTRAVIRLPGSFHSLLRNLRPGRDHKNRKSRTPSVQAAWLANQARPGLCKVSSLNCPLPEIVE